MLLNNDKRCLGWSKISSGGSNSTIVEQSFVFQSAMLANAQSIIVAHNHPSGRLKESVADIALTRRLVEGGKLFGIPISDHIIISGDG